jgi:hypothetical protein
LRQSIAACRNLHTMDIWNLIDKSVTFPPTLSQVFQYGKLRKFHMNGLYPPHSLDHIGLCRNIQDLRLNLYNEISFEEFKAVFSFEKLRKLTLTKISLEYLMFLVPLQRPKLQHLELGLESYDGSITIIANCFTGLKCLALTSRQYDYEITKEGNVVTSLYGFENIM